MGTSWGLWLMPLSHRKQSYLKSALFSSTALAFMMTGANATPFNESNCPGMDMDAGGSMGEACPVPDGTTSISGTVTDTSDEQDWFKFNNLVPGSEFGVFADELSPFDFIQVYNQAGDFQFNLEGTGLGDSFELGDLDTMAFIQVFANEEGSFTATVSASFATPEPASTAVLGVGAAGLAALRRRKKRPTT